MIWQWSRSGTRSYSTEAIPRGSTQGAQQCAYRPGPIGWSVQRSEQYRSVDLVTTLSTDHRMHELQRTPDGKRSVDRQRGQEDRRPRALPGDAGWYPTGLAGTAGIVLSQLPTYGNHGNDEEIWNPLTNHVVRVFHNAFVIGANGNQFVWQVAARTAPPDVLCTCSMSEPGLSERCGSLAGATATGDAAISPDGSTIAITAALGRTSRIPNPQAVLSIQPGDRVARVGGGLGAVDQSQPRSDGPHLVDQRLVVFVHCWHYDSSCLETW